MIDKISFKGFVRVRNDNMLNDRVYIQPMKCDTFERTEKPLDKKEIAYNEAKKRIIDELNKTGFERQIVISPDGEILDDRVGDDYSCDVDTDSIIPYSMLCHGHPVQWPLSIDDIALFLTTNAISEEAITNDGKYSKLTKKELFKLNKNTKEVYQELEKTLGRMVLDKLNIKHEVDMDDAMDMAREFLEYVKHRSYSQSNNDEITDELKMFGIDTTQEPEQIIENLKKFMFHQVLMQPEKYDKLLRVMNENLRAIDDFLKTPDGVKIRHEINRLAAKEYNLIYETNME